MNPGPPYGDTPDERARELTETGSSVRHTGTPILTALIAALSEPGDDRAGLREAAAADAEAAEESGVVVLTWHRLASGNYGAAGRGRYYLAGPMDDSRWFLESWPADNPDTGDTTLRLATLGAAEAEADEREQVAWLLHGKYHVPVDDAHEVMATARRLGHEVVRTELRDRLDGSFVEGWRVKVATDPGGYTVKVEAHETAADREV